MLRQLPSLGVTTVHLLHVLDVDLLCIQPLKYNGTNWNHRTFFCGHLPGQPLVLTLVRLADLLEARKGGVYLSVDRALLCFASQSV